MDNATADTVQAAGWAITYLTIRMFLAEMNRAMTTNRLDGHTRPYWIRGSSEYIETKHYKRLYSGVTGTMSSSRVVTYGLTERFTMKPAHEFDKLLRGDEVQELVPFSRQHIHRLEKAGQFPRRIHLGARRVAWKLSDVVAWLESKQQESTVN